MAIKRPLNQSHRNRRICSGSKSEGNSPMANNLMVFTGNANPMLAEKIARYIGIPLGDAQIGRFSDGEVMVEIKENVRGKDVFIIQSTCAPKIGRAHV